MTYFAAFAALVLTIAGYLRRQATLTFAAAGFWVVFAVYAYTLSATPKTGIWDTNYGMFFICVGLVIVCSLEPVIMRPPKAEEKEDIYLSDIDKLESDYDELAKQTRIPRIGRMYRARRSKPAKKGPQY